jgi:uncharacterized protein
MKSFLSPLVRTDAAAGFVLTNTRNNRIVAHTLLPAFDSNTRRTGLLKHESLEEGHAMIIAPTNAVHTFWMRFAIDIAFVTREGRVVKVCSTVVPWRIAVAWGGYAVVELAAGALSRSETQRGDVLQLAAREDR